MSNQNFYYLEKSDSSSLDESALKLSHLELTQDGTREQVLASNQAESKVWQGIKLEQDNRLDLAIEHYREAVKLNSQSVVAHHILAIALKKQNNLAEADYYHRLALSLNQNNNGDRAKNIVEQNKKSDKITQSFDSVSDSPMLKIKSQPDLQGVAASNSEQTNNSNSSVVLPKLIAVAPGTYVEHSQLEVTKVYLQQAKLYYSDARWQESIDACEEALKVCADLPETYKIYGNSLQQMGKLPEAMGYYAKALAKDPHMAEVYANIGSLYAKKSDWQEAIDYFQKSLSIAPDQAKICLHLSRAWERIGENRKALETLLRALSLQPDILTVDRYLQLVDELIAEAEIELAIACCETGLKMQSPAKTLYLKLIKILERDGQIEKAARYRHIVANLSENESSGTFNKLRIQRLLSSPTAKRLPPGKSNASAIASSQPSPKPKMLSQGSTEENLSVRQYLAELAKQPNSSEIRLKLGNLLVRQQRWQEAASYYQQVIKLEPKSAIAYLRLGKIYGILGKHLEGAELIYRAYSIDPEMGTPEKHYQLGEFWLRRNKGKIAMGCYRRAIQLKPGFKAAYCRLQQLIALETKQSKSASVENDKLQQLSPSQTAEALSFVERAIAAVKAQDWQLAAQQYQQAILIAPQNYRYRYNLGEVWVKLDQWQAAIECYQQAAQLEPSNADIQHNLGEVYSHELAWEDAAKAYKNAIALGTKNSWTHHNLGYALLQLEQWESSADYFTQAIELKDDFVWSHYNLGEALANLGRWDEALNAYHAAQKIDPDLPEVKIKIGSILYQRSQHSQQKALSYCKNQIALDPDNIELYHQAIALNKKDPELYIGLGKALINQGKIEEAISIYQIASQIQPRNPELIRELDLLREKKVISNSNIAARIENIVSSTLTEKETEELDYAWELPQHSSPVVSIVIPVYNQVDYTVKCLHSIAKHVPLELPIEVIVVNDCSTDNTVETLNQIKGLKLIDNQENLGFLHSCNRGVKSASGEYVYFLNNDTELQPQALEHLLSVLEREADVGAVGSKLVYPDGTLQEAGGIVFKNGSAWNYGTKNNANAPKYNYLRPVDYCSGASLLVKRTVFWALNGFDTNLTPAYYEDTDLCFAIRHQLGLKVMYQPKSVVVHHEGISCGKDLDSPIKRYQEINQAKFVQKWTRELINYSEDSSPAGIAAASRRYLGRKTILIADLYAPCYDKESGARRIWELLQICQQLNYHVIFVVDNGVREQPYVEMLQDRSVEVIYQEAEYKLTVEQQFEELLPLVDIAWLCRPELYEKYAPLV
ncbi:MAG: tetratricopeptide repeat protein, partial [Cyanobacteria bacterium P01_G01_bin.19]